MSFIDRGDDEFERALLRSAIHDMPDPRASERAWRRFAALMGGVAMTLRVPERISAPPATAGSVGRFWRSVAAAKWLVVGAIGGSAVTFALVGGHAAPPVLATSVALTSTTRPPSAISAPPLTPMAPSMWIAAESQPSPSVASTSSAARSSDHALARRAVRDTEALGPPTRGVAPATRDEASSLAAEVAELDMARSALDARTPDDALAALRRYLRDFPKGKLVPEAQVMGIEALAAKGDRARVSKEATRFLARYPNAPQRTRVEQLRAEAGEN